MSRKEALQVQMKAFLPELEKASEIAYQADNESRDMTPEEKAIANPILQRGKELTEAMRQVKSDEAVLAEAKAMSARVGVASSAPPSGGRLDGKRISFKGMGARAASKMVGEYGQKALAPSRRGGRRPTVRRRPYPVGPHSHRAARRAAGEGTARPPSTRSCGRPPGRTTQPSSLMGR